MRFDKGMTSATALTLITAVAFASSAIAADLPQSGSVKIHSAFKVNNQAAEMGDKHFMGSFNAWAITYNDAGSGPLHMGTALCAGSFNDTNGSYDDGDRISSDWCCEFRSDGRFANIGLQWLCWPVAGPGLLSAARRYDAESRHSDLAYRLPKRGSIY